MVVTPRLQRLGDLASGTIVVVDRRAADAAPPVVDTGPNFIADMVPAGLRLGWALLDTRGWSRLESLQRTAPEALATPRPLPLRPTNGRIVSLDDAPAGVAAVTKQSRLALASLVLGVLTCPFFCLTGIPGLICGVMGLRQIEASERPGAPVRYTGRSRALAGIILSGVMPFILLFWMGFQVGREAAICANHVDVIGLAFRNAASTNKQLLMPLAIVDADGRPLLSWRVALLPFIGQE